MGKRTPKEVFALPPDLADYNPALVRTAELAGFGTNWKSAIQSFVDILYNDNPAQILEAAQQRAQYPGVPEAEAELVTLRRDFARCLLLRCAKDPQAITTQAPRLYAEALQVSHDPSFVIMLAQAGADLRTPRLGEAQDTILMRALGQCDRPAQVVSLLETLTPAERPAYLAMRNKLGMTALHFLAHTPHTEERPFYIQGMASTLHAQGAVLADEVKFDYGTGPQWGNIAHLAVASGQKELTAELMALDRNLFAVKADSRIEQSPFELGCQLVEQQQLKVAAGRAWELVAAAFTAVVTQGNMKVVAVAPHGSPLENTPLHELKAATNLAAYALDKPLPFGDALAVVEGLGPLTAPKATVTEQKIILH